MSQRMLADIEAHFNDTLAATGLGALSPSVRAAMASVDRGFFIEGDGSREAYRDSALPIGSGQTISQPFIVALMTQLLMPRPYQRILEVGTGSGYQTAVLAQLVSEVFSLEIIDVLASSARQRMAQLGYARVSIRCADGYQGWHEKAPFDSIIITAAINEIPGKLLGQLREGGRMVLPLGKPGGAQQLVLVEKPLAAPVSVRPILPVRFVPFTRSH